MQRAVPSFHFLKRSAQRNLAPQEIVFILEHGRRLYGTGIKFYFLGWRDIPENLRRNPHVARLEGTTVLLSHDGTLITAYKNPQALRKIKRKPKHGCSCHLCLTRKHP